MGLDTKPLSTLHEHASYDVADFPVPTGREEKWRFTPLRRLRDLHKGVAADGKVLVEASAAPGVTVETAGRDDPRVGRAYVPSDRVSAQAYTAFTQATVVTVPKEAEVAEPVVLTMRGEGGVAYGHTTVIVEPYAKATVVLINLPEDQMKIPKGRENWHVGGIVAYSKICTHVGCPAALYEQTTHHILCPCHQSTFDAANGANVIFGPAARALPQLPLTLNSEGYIVAASDFTQPVGPSFWERG